MRQECIAATEAALGRPLLAPETRDIETRIAGAMRRLAAKNTAQWLGMPQDQRMAEAGKVAARELIEEAQKKAARIALTIMARTRLDAYLNDQVGSGADKTKLDALVRVLVGKNDGRNNTTPIEHEANAIFSDAMRRMADAVDALRPGLWKALPWTDPAIQREFYEALAGTGKPRPEIKAAADAFHQIAEEMRLRWNAAGGAVGKLENWDLPHGWSDRVAARVGEKAWVDAFMGFVDRSKYVHDDGRRFSDQEMRAFLSEAWHTVASDGATKERETVPGGASLKANRHRAHRALHLKPESVPDALTQFTERNALEVVVGHLRRVARDQALIMRFGPNADLMFQDVMQKAQMEAARADPTKTNKYTETARYLQAYFDHLGGNNPPPANRALADTMQILRSVEVATKLGGASVAALVQDPVFLHLTAHQNRLSQFKVFLNQLMAFNGKSRRWATRAGLLIDTMIGHADRFAHDNVSGRAIASTVAGEVLRLSGLNFVTEMRRMAFSVTMMDAIGHLTRRYQDVTRLKREDVGMLATKGIDQATWDIWRQARLERRGVNATLLTPDAIMALTSVPLADRQAAVVKLLAVVREEQDIAVIQPGTRERVQLTGGATSGTIMGEIARTMMLFKSFPWAVITRQWERAIDPQALMTAARTPGLGGKTKALAKYTMGHAGAIAALVIMTTTAGILLNWVRDILSGRNPRSINPMGQDRDIAVRNIVQGFMTGGAFGIYGDFLFTAAQDPQRGGNTLAETLAGPVISRGAQTFNLVQGNIAQALAGEETNFGPEAARYGYSFMPNLWYTKALTDRAILYQLQEAMQPGYVAQMQARARQQRGTTYYWEPDEAAPTQGPDLATAVQ